MKIAFISFDYGEYCIRNANAIARADGAQVLLLLPESKAGSMTGEIAPNVERDLFQRPRFRQPLKQMRMLTRLVQRIRKFNPDVVHFQGAHLWFNFILPLLRRYPLVVTAHNPKHHIGDKDSRRTPQWVMDFGFRQAGELIVHGDSLKAELQDHLGVAAERVHAVPHIAMGGGVQPNAVAEDPHMVLFFGRIWEYKGLEYLIRAEPLISQQCPDVRIVIAGKGDDFGRYAALIQNPERFEIHNERVSDEKRERLFAESAVVVLPYIGATQSGVIPIALNHGKPVVATRVGALAEVVHDGETGYLVPSRDEQALAEAIVKLLKDPELRTRMGAAGKQLLRSQCSDAVVAEKHLAVYQAAIESHSHPRNQAVANREAVT